MTPIRPLTPLSTIAETEKQSGTLREQAGMPFASILDGAMQNLRETQAAAAKDSYDLAMGNVSDLHAVMIRANQESIAIDSAVQITSRAVSSYKEIMQMQI